MKGDSPAVRRRRAQLEKEGMQLLLWSYRRELLGTEEPRPDQDQEAQDHDPHGE